MNKNIIYPLENGYLGFVIPADENRIDEISNICVPKGKPYIVITVDDVPKDDFFQEAWECDFSNPDGYSTGTWNYDNTEAKDENTIDEGYENFY